MKPKLKSASDIEEACSAVHKQLQADLRDITFAIAAINPAFDLAGAIRSLHAGVSLQVSVASASIEGLISFSGYTEAEKAILTSALEVLKRVPDFRAEHGVRQ